MDRRHCARISRMDTSAQRPWCATATVLRYLDGLIRSRPPEQTTKRLRAHVSGRAGPAPRDLLQWRSTAGAESAWWLSPAPSRCGIFPTAQPPGSPPSSVWPIGAGRRATHTLPAPPQPLSLTCPRIYPYRRWRMSFPGRCLQHGEARHLLSTYGHGHH